MAARVIEMPEEKREVPRAPLLLTAALEDINGTQQVHLLNLSPTGAKLDSEEPPSCGEAVMLIAAGERIEGRVAWVEDHRFGVAFRHPIDPKTLLRRGQQHLAG